MAIGGSTTDTHDPFAELTAPPPGETPSQKAIREKKEAEAKRISERIDDEIKAQRAVMKKQKDVVKVLLLGQSESGEFTPTIQSMPPLIAVLCVGKSTTLKSELTVHILSDHCN